MSRVVVIGGGVAGLAAAARLAAAGHRVTLLEQAPEVGGKLGVHQHAGFTFDTGPSLLTMPEVFQELFAATGDPLDRVLPLRRLDPLASYRWPDGTLLDLPAEAQLTGPALDAALGPGTGVQWLRLLRRGARLEAATRQAFLEAPLASPAKLARLALRRPTDVRVVAPGTTLRGLGRRMLADPRLRMMLERYATFSGSDPRRAPAALAVIAWLEQDRGVWYVPGGLRRLGLALADRARQRGADIRCGDRVTGIDAAGGHACGVQLDGGDRLPAEVVVGALDAEVVYRRLLGVRPPGVLRRLAGPGPSMSGFALLLGLRGRTPALGHHTVFFPHDYDAEFDAVFAGLLAADPTIYVSKPADPALVPDPDAESWFVLVNAPPHGSRAGQLDWRAPGVAARYAALVLDLLARRGFDVRARVATCDVRTPADIERDTGSPAGSIYGMSTNGRGAALLRPANRSPVKGLFLAGGSVHPGGGLPLVALSAKIVADLVGPA
ncbi:MAG: phytoene desaturase family protein [Frankiaceae bacterium]